MYIELTVGSAPTLHEPETFTAFSVVVPADATTEQLQTIFETSDLGLLEEEHAFLLPDRVADLAGEAGVRDNEWAVGFASMLEYARSRGWFDETGTRVRAHLERR